MSSQTPDVLVVGAGIVGAACAYELARRGLDVTLVDGGSVGAGATAEGMGHLVVLDDSPTQLALTRWSLDLWGELAPTLPSSCEMTPSGTLWIAEDDEDLAALQRKASLYAKEGVAGEMLSAAELRREEPNLRKGLPGALRTPGDSVIYPPAAAVALVERAQRDHGLEFRQGDPVLELTALDGGPAEAHLASGEVLRAGWIVNAAGHRALDLLPAPLPSLRIRQRKGHLLITDRYPGFCRHQLVEVGYLKSAHGSHEDSVAFNLQPRPNGQLLLGSSRQFGDLSRQVDPALLARMVARAQDFVPGLKKLSTLRVWTGFRAATQDHLPILGPVPDHGRLLLAAGHEGLGITTALASGRLIAEQILQLPPSLPLEPFRADRLVSETDPTSSAEREHGLPFSERLPLEMNLGGGPCSLPAEDAGSDTGSQNGTGLGRLWIDQEPFPLEDGMTVAAALANRGQESLRRSVENHPRSPLCGMGVCFECRVTIDGEPHRLACQTSCGAGLEIETGEPAGVLSVEEESLRPPHPTSTASVQTVSIPGIQSGDGELPGEGSSPLSLAPAQTVSAPSSEPSPGNLRRGSLSSGNSTDLPAAAPALELSPGNLRQEAGERRSVTRSWDVVVVGGGPAGVAAAVRAAEAGRRTALLDNQRLPGGQIWRRKRQEESPDGAALWLKRLGDSGVEILGETTVVQGAVDGALVRLEATSRDGLLRAEAGKVVLATGARERFLPFPGWTLPGVFGVGGLQALVKGGQKVRGRRVLVAGSGPLLLAVAADLKRRGAEVVGIVEQTPWDRLLPFGLGLVRHPGKLLQLLQLRTGLLGVPQFLGSWPVRALGTNRLEAVEVQSQGGRLRTFEADALACGFGLVPETRLAKHLGCSVDEGRVQVDEDQKTSRPGVLCAGEPTGIGGVELSLIEGEIAGLVAADDTRGLEALKSQRDRSRRFAKDLEHAFSLRPELRDLPSDDTLVCRCEDVAWGRIRHARNLREAKLHSRCGMGPCQGRVCAPALNFLRGWSSGPPRPPLFPLPMDRWTHITTDPSTYSTPTTNST